MRVCDLCRETSLEKEKAEIKLRIVFKQGNLWLPGLPEDDELQKQLCDREVCLVCFKKLMTLFKGGGDKE